MVVKGEDDLLADAAPEVDVTVATAAIETEEQEGSEPVEQEAVTPL